MILGVTGHPDGSLICWTEGKNPLVVSNYDAQITSIKALTDDFAISTASGQIFLVFF